MFAVKGAFHQRSTSRHIVASILVALSVVFLASCVTAPGANNTALPAIVEPVTYPGQQDADRFFWSLTKDGQTIHILGSIHVATEEIYPLDLDIIEAFSSSDLLIEEVDIFSEDLSEAQRFITENSALEAGRSLEDYLPEPELSDLKDILFRYNIPWDSVSRLQPWVVSNTLTLLSSYEVNMDPSMGIDVYFASEALDNNIPVYGLETSLQQLQYVSSVSLESQARDLAEAIAEFENLDEALFELLETWLSGDMAKMENLIIDVLKSDPDYREFYQIMIENRNRDWAQQIAALREDQAAANIFVVVGTGHLIGEDSLINLLIEQGYSAQRY